MKLYLASFLEPHNFGPGRVISIANGDKPDHIECDQVFPWLVPSIETTKQYRDESLNNPKVAGKNFVDRFTSELDAFMDELTETCKKDGVTPQDILPFEDGDTLASWERADFTNYRRLVAPYLEKLGYEVVNN